MEETTKHCDRCHKPYDSKELEEITMPGEADEENMTYLKKKIQVCQPCKPAAKHHAWQVYALGLINFGRNYVLPHYRNRQ